MPKPYYFELLDACDQPGCPVCRLAQRSVQSYLDILFYENVNDGGIRQRLRRSMGFCNLHAWQILETGVGDALGVSMIYHDILENVLRRLPRGDSYSASSPQGGLLSSLGLLPKRLPELMNNAIQALTPKAVCPACEQLEISTDIILSTFVESLDKEEFVQAFRSSSGLCLPHFRQSLERVRKEEHSQTLLAIEWNKLKNLSTELAEIIRKNDYRFREEEFGEERDAWLRVIGVAAGEQPYKKA
jgi:hypothetical protein